VTAAPGGPAAPDHAHFLRLAIEEATRGVRAGAGGPFGAVIVRDGQVLARGCNEVTSRNDPTAHAEVQAIRAACAALGSFQLTGCDLYASCEPCPMCLGAIYWARPRAVYHAASRIEAAAAGFDDAFIYEELERGPADRRLPLVHLPLPEAHAPFGIWRSLADRIRY
jgi:tRNA(Arg) A34 adenosine deaminase TadA